MEALLLLGAAWAVCAALTLVVFVLALAHQRVCDVRSWLAAVVCALFWPFAAVGLLRFRGRDG